MTTDVDEPGGNASDAPDDSNPIDEYDEDEGIDDAPGELLNELPPDWQRHQESSEGRWYYYNVASGETTWDLPISNVSQEVANCNSSPEAERSGRARQSTSLRVDRV